MDLSKQEELMIVKQQQKQIAAAIYNQVINKRVADKVDDKKLSESATAELVRLEKIKDELAVIHAEVEKAIQNKE